MCKRIQLIPAPRGFAVFPLVLLLVGLGFSFQAAAVPSNPQGDNRLTPRQAEISKQQQRLNSGDTEERRDALLRLGWMRHPDASRAALPGLKDAEPIVKVTAITAILWLPAEESAAALIPMLVDKDEFVRQEAAYALGKTGSRSAVDPLLERLTSDKMESVRAAAAVALGQLKDERAVVTLANVLAPHMSGATGKGARRTENAFILRAAARSLGQIGNRAAVPALISVVSDEKLNADVRREAAQALGAIGDPTANSALHSLLVSEDPYLASAANDALKRLSARGASRP